jgi:hypothetical protein
MRAARTEAEEAPRNPIRGIFVGCCASAKKAVARRTIASSQMAILFIFSRQQVNLSDCDLLGPEIHHEGFTSQQLGSDKDVLSFSRNAVDWTPLPVKDNLSEVDFLLHQSSRGNLKLFRPDSKPFAPNQ